jgi:RHS repeat-associated protein
VRRSFGRTSLFIGLAVLSLVACLALGVAGASAEPLCTDSWTGPSEGRWETAADWSSASVPGSSDVVCIGSGDTVEAGGSVDHAGVLEVKGTLEITGTLEVSDALEASSVASLSLSGGTLRGAGTVDVSGSLAWPSGELSGSGSLVLGSGVSVAMSGSGERRVANGYVLANEGTITLSGGRLSLLEGAQLRSSGVFKVNSETSPAIAFGGSGVSIRNSGTFERTEGTGTATVEPKFENLGTVDAQSGSLSFTEGGTSSGTNEWHAAEGSAIELENGSFALVGGSMSGSVKIERSDVSMENVNGSSAKLTLSPTGEIDELSIPGGATTTIGHLSMVGGTIAGAGTLDVSNSLSRTGTSETTMTGSGSTKVLSGASAVLESSGTLVVQGSYSLINEGTMTQSSGSIGLDESAELENSGIFKANSERNPTIGRGGELSKIVNTGSFEKTEGSGTARIEPSFVNLGSIKHPSGAINIEKEVLLRESDSSFGPEGVSAPEQPRSNCGDPVNCATGNLSEAQTDFAVGGRGVGLELARTYNSQAAANGVKGVFGYGWTSSFSDRLVVEKASKTAVLHQAEGSSLSFAEGSGGTFTAPVWTQDILTGTEATGYTLTLADQIKYKFAGSSGRLESVTDRNGNATTLTYNEAGQLTTITDPDSRTIKLAYNGEGLVESAEDPMKHVVKYTYEGGNLKSVTQPGEAGLRWQFKYNGSHELTEMVDGRAGKTLNEYNGSNQVVKQEDPAGHKLKFEYAPFETKITDESTGAVTLKQFTSNGEPFAITQGYGTALASTEAYTYNEAGYVTSETNGDGHTTRYGYDGENNRTSMVDPDSNETKWTYDSTHDVETTTTPDGETTTIKREAHGNPETISRPTPSGTQTTTYKYDAHGDLTSVENPLKETWKYEYDGAGDRTSETDPEGDKRTWGYNEDSQETSTVSPRGHVGGAKESSFTTTTERDAQGRPIKVTDPLGHETKYAYDGDGNLEIETDPEGNKTTYTYNADDQPTKVHEANGDTTETEYDGAGQVVSQTDGDKHTTKYTRNVLEQVTEVTDPLGRKTSKEYDAAGNLTSVKDAAERTTTYKYDPDGRLVEATYSDGKTPTVKYEYNGDGDRTKMVDGSGETLYTYDKLDRLTESKDGHGDTTGYEYNVGDEQAKITYPNGKSVTRAYDNDGRLKSVTDWLENTTKFAYSPDSELSATTYPSGTSDEDAYAYDDSDAMSEVKMKKSTETLASLAYTRDKDGDVTKVNSKDLPGEEKPAFTYDEDSRLTKGEGTKYAYDAANNSTTIGEDTYSYNTADELEKSALKTATVATYAYNEVGERTKTTPAKGPATTYGYDQAGNLITVSRPKEGETSAIEDSYAYNGEALRTSETIGASTSYIAWDVAEGLPLILSNGAYSFVYGPGGLPVEQINNSSGAVTYLHHDQAGSTRLLTGATGTVTGKCTYSAYGTPTCEGASTTPLGYDAQYTSSDTGLIYMRARVYDPSTAQFLTRDPWVSITGEPYSYVGDNPLTFADPTGRCSFWCVTGIVAGGVALGTGVGEVVIGGGAVAEGVLGGISAVSGFVGAGADAKECVSGSGIACVGAGVGSVATGGAAAVAFGVVGGTTAAGTTAIGLTASGIGSLGDVAGALASPNTPEGSTARGCG